MTMIDVPTIFVLVDDWYQRYGHQLKPTSPGPQPKFSESEMLTLLLAMDYLPFTGENQLLGFIRANYLSLFPHLLDQSQFNRRVRRLEAMLEELRRFWVRELDAVFETTLMLDTKPVLVVGYKRSKHHSDFVGSASYGHCASRNLKYFGYKLVVLSTLNGIPAVYALVPPHTDEREAAEAVLKAVNGCDILADKGFIGDDWQAEVFRNTGNQVFTVKQENQHEQRHQPSRSY